ncbi:hypothetical protein FH972_019423 [Carpinus fangiana]|uniref:Uncharacterized protein n=1 Tax=Carpinus fangiana TaxID=176857 RepID=A0A5N6RTD0_9ROSI|nr:hypothetical protein FH972_019423 [Carpinus fangiana]
MIFSDRKSVDRLPKKGDVHGSCKNPFSSCLRQSASGVIIGDGADEKPRLVFKIKLPPSQNKGEKPCKVSEDRADEKTVPTPASGTNIVEEKPRLVFKIKLPPSLNKGKKSCKEKNDGKDDRLVPTTSSGNGVRNGYPFKKPISRCPTKSASRVATKKPFPTSSTAAKKACHVTRAIKLPTPNTKGIELNGKSGGQSDPKSAMDDKLALMPSSGGKKERRVIKIIKSSALRQNKEEQLNTTREVALQKTESTNESSTLAKTTEKSCLKNVQMDEKALELKLEASRRKLHQRYQQDQNAKRKIELIDFKDIPKPENAPKRSKNQYRRL